MADRFEQWCILEIMGHQKYAGLVTEQALGGSSFVRIDVPECGNQAAFSKLFGASSIYAITPVTEEVARGVAATLKQQPLSVWEIPDVIKEKYRQAVPALNGPDVDPIDASFNDNDEDDYE